MLYVCIPSYNEAVTVGVLLWRLRTMLREEAGGRDYEVVVYDDASTDATAEVLAPYARVLPLTVLRGRAHAGQSAAVNALVAHVVQHSQTPETDAVVFLQADYTDGPELLPLLLERFAAGADLVLTRRVTAPEQPLGERRLRRAAAVVLGPLTRAAVGDADARDAVALVSFLRLVRVSVLRDALAAGAGQALVRAPGSAGTAEFAVRVAPLARRIERVDTPARYDVRTRPSRIDWTRELRAIAAVLWQSRRRARSGARAPRGGSLPARSGATVAVGTAPQLTVSGSTPSGSPAAGSAPGRGATRPADRADGRPRRRPRPDADTAPLAAASLPPAPATRTVEPRPAAPGRSPKRRAMPTSTPAPGSAPDEAASAGTARPVSTARERRTGEPGAPDAAAQGTRAKEPRAPGRDTGKPGTHALETAESGTTDPTVPHPGAEQPDARPHVIQQPASPDAGPEDSGAAVPGTSAGRRRRRGRGRGKGAALSGADATGGDELSGSEADHPQAGDRAAADEPGHRESSPGTTSVPAALTPETPDEDGDGPDADATAGDPATRARRRRRRGGARRRARGPESDSGVPPADAAAPVVWQDVPSDPSSS